jgi:hypothetical protein
MRGQQEGLAGSAWDNQLCSITNVLEGVRRRYRECRRRPRGSCCDEVAYSDGATGTLVVVCSLGLPAGTPANVIEGTTAIKGFVDYADPVFPTDSSPLTGNTLFHVIHGHEE